MQSENLDLLQQKLKESLGDKKFLLVLDDVWEKCCSEWEGLRIPLLAAGEGSKVVVTTRNPNVGKIMRADHTHPLEGLSEAHCWSLFQKLAFENKDSCPYPQVLESIGRKLVAKCRGLPLAVKALRSLLYSKTDRREWEQILESEIWGLQDHEILPSLLSSYKDLPLHLKQCFAYCSIFSKDHEFDKDTLILLWMAGLLHFSKGNDRMGKVGEQYFDELQSKSFFQKSALKESCFVMHDLIHHLAQYISKVFCIGFEDDKVKEISENTRHSLNFISNFDGMVMVKRFGVLAKINCLRTYFELKREMDYFYIK